MNVAAVVSLVQRPALTPPPSQGNVSEFTAYRLLYFVYTESASSTNVLLNTLVDSPSLASSPAVAHALQVLNAHTSRNYHRFFSLYKVCVCVCVCVCVLVYVCVLW
jgi:hypothetical protein